LYFTWQLKYTEETAIAYFAYVTCLAYLSPILGALLADGSWGRYHTIWRFGLIYVLGLAILSVAAASGSSNTSTTNNNDNASASHEDASTALTTQRTWTAIGLSLICVGTGGIKPCVSAFGADQVSLQHQQPTHHANAPSQQSMYEQVPQTQKTQEQHPTRQQNDTTTTETEVAVRQFFSYFYVCINVGAVTSFVVVPYTRVQYGFGPAFTLSLIFMSAALFLFVSKRHQYIHHSHRVPTVRTNGTNNNNTSSSSSSLLTNFVLCWWLLRHSWWHYTWFRTLFPWLRPSPTIPTTTRRVGNHDDHNFNDDVQETINPHPDDTTFMNVPKEPQEEVEDRILHQQLYDAAQAIHVLPILCMFPIFWCLYDQQSSVWTLQATKMRMNWEFLTPETMNAINPLQIMIFLPCFTQFLYPQLQSWGWDISPLRRMGWGMVLAALSFSVSGWVEAAIEQSSPSEEEVTEESRISVLWQIPQITILSIAEILVSVTGLEFAYATSPHRLKAFLMALFLLTTAVGDFFSGILYSTVFVGVNRARVMHICALLMLGNRVVFAYVARWWQSRDAHALSRQFSRTSSRGSGISGGATTTTTTTGIELEDRRIV
jgi:POT family proton-dependent oligopeptide transporter